MSSGLGSPPIGVERYATMVVALREPFAPRRDILDDAGLTEEAWRRAEQAWSERVQSDAPTAQLFQKAFRAAKEAIGAGGEPREVARAVRDQPPIAKPPETPAPGPVPVAAVVVLAPEPAPPSLPQAPAPRFPMPTGIVVPRVSVSASVVDTTLPPRAALEPALPFGKRPAADPAANPRQPPATDTHDQSGATIEVELGHLFAATPFDAEAPVDGTQLGPALEDREPLPFRPANSSPAPIAANMAPHDAMGGTAFHEPVVFDEPLPFAAPLDRMAHPFQAAPVTLAQLAAIYIELQHDHRQSVLMRYHLTEEQYQQVDGERRALPSRDARFAGAWDEACQAYRNWRSQKNAKVGD